MFSKHSIFKTGVFFFWIAGLALTLIIPKLELHRHLNTYHSTFLDSIAKYSTHVGDGLFFSIVIIVFLFISLRTSILLLISFLISSLIAQFFKKIVFPDMMRPMHYFQQDSNFYKIENFTYHFNNSFPSGHATSCFALFTILALTYSNNKFFKIACLVAAILFSFTRVYLSQHFFQDLLAGSIIGVFVAQFVFKYLNPLLGKWDYSVLKKKPIIS